MWSSKPANAWRNHIFPEAKHNSLWVEDSRPISDSLLLSKRELFSLIILAQACNSHSPSWRVGYDPNDPEPNDGFIVKGEKRVQFEHKTVAQMQKEDVLSAIISVYERNANKGMGYGDGRVLVIQPNKNPAHGPGGLVKISDLTNAIGKKCPFDKVILITMVTEKNGEGIFHLTQHYPKLASRKNRSNITQVNFNFLSGLATVPHVGFSIC